MEKKTTLKQFEASVTGLTRNLFLWARIKLTVLYVGLIALMLTVFSVMFYYSLSQQLHNNFHISRYSPSEQIELYDRTMDSIQNIFITTDLIVLLIIGGLSYLLAGETLRPIQRALDAQKRFSADASHELRTPLAVMRDEAGLLLRQYSKSLPEDVKKGLISNVEEIDRMSLLVEQLLFLSRTNFTPSTPLDRIDLATSSLLFSAKY